jgi:hypothetical protein
MADLNEKIDELHYELQSELNGFEYLVEDTEADGDLPEYYMDKLKFALEEVQMALHEVEQYGWGHLDEKGHIL